MHAARNKNADAVNALVEAGADIEAKDDNGETALMKASFWGNIEAVRALLAAGADRKAQDHDDRTAQQIAEEIGQMKIVELLNE
jgi:ankyrin repeat protein